jgi:hypothetical protein
MADDRMKNDQRNMGGGAKDQDYGQQAPGRQQGGQEAGGRQDKSNYGSGQNKHDMEDDDLDTGQTGGQGRGGQNR